MQILIDMSDELYKGIKRRDGSLETEYVCDELMKAVDNGIMLPKNHGRLIDAEQLMNYCQNQIDGHKYADCNVIARFSIVLNAEVKE